MAFFKNCTFVFDTISFFFSGLAELSVDLQASFFKTHWIVDKEGTISAAKINAQQHTRLSQRWLRLIFASHIYDGPDSIA